jgi:hypothetical protein
MKLCTLLVALFGKFRDLKYSVSLLEVQKSCSINFQNTNMQGRALCQPTLVSFRWDLRGNQCQCYAE